MNVVNFHGMQPMPNRCRGVRAVHPQAVHVSTLAGGKAVRFQQYIDTLDVARATGAAAA